MIQQQFGISFNTCKVAYMAEKGVIFTEKCRLGYRIEDFSSHPFICFFLK